MSEWIDFGALREHLSFRDVLVHYKVDVKSNSTQHHGFCPLPTHNSVRNSASFSANLQKKIWQCFGCGAKGNIIDFAARMEGLDPGKGGEFRKAAKVLADRFTVAVSNSRPQPDQKKDVRPTEDKKEKLLNEPLDFELKQLDFNHPYLRNRGFTKGTIDYFGLGYCSRGYQKERIAIPLHDGLGRLIGYAGRLIDDSKVNETTPKYLFPGPREREGQKFEFKKSLLLYRGHTITSSVDHLVVAEGFAAVWWLAQARVVHSVALMGAACSDVQAELIVAKVSPKGLVWILPDGDKAGLRMATEVFTKVAPHRAVRLCHLKEDSQATDYSPEELRKSVGLSNAAIT